MNPFERIVADVQQWLFEHAAGPLLYALGLAAWHEDAFDALEGVVLGGFMLVGLFVLIRPLEALRPAEPVRDRRAVRTDLLYAVLNRLGVVPLGVFLLFDPMERAFGRLLDDLDLVPLTLEGVVPWFDGRPLATLLAYVLILDFAEYWRHRFQHAFRWWWALHALHHDQRQMSLFTDSRNHLLDDVLRHLWIAAVALAVGAPPASYLTVVLLIMAVESLSHANLRLSFGPALDRVLVSPRFHRRHHAVDQAGVARGCNFGVLFAFWDVLFRTARFDPVDAATGIADDDGPPFGPTWAGQQAVGLRRFLRAVAGR